MKQQLEQLLKDAKEVTAKMREALAQMDKPSIAATYEKVIDVVKPKSVCYDSGNLGVMPSYGKYFLPSKSAAKQDRAFIQIKNLEAYCAAKFPGERDHIIDIYSNGELCSMECTYGIIKVTREAAEWLIANHSEPFLVFFGVKS